MHDEIVILELRFRSASFQLSSASDKGSFGSSIVGPDRQVKFLLSLWLLAKNIDDLLFQIEKCYQFLRVQKLFISFCYGHGACIRSYKTTP